MSDNEKVATAQKRGFIAHQMLVGGKTEEQAKEAYDKQLEVDKKTEENFETRKEACVRIREKLAGAKAE